jgi:hypothetical protein
LFNPPVDFLQRVLFQCYRHLCGAHRYDNLSYCLWIVQWLGGTAPAGALI